MALCPDSFEVSCQMAVLHMGDGREGVQITR